MFSELTPPDAEILNSFGSMNATLTADATGEKARRIAQFLRSAEMETRHLQLRQTDFEARRRAERLADALGASSRVVLAVWSRQHGRELLL